MAIKKEDNCPCILKVKIDGEKKPMSPFILKLISSKISQEEIDSIRKGEMTIHQSIQSFGIQSKGDDPIGYELLYNTIEYFTGNYAAKNTYREVVLENYMDIQFLFNTQTKMNNFLAYILKKSIHYDDTLQLPVLLHGNSIIFELGYLLKLMEEYMVDEYHAVSSDVKDYLRNYFLNNRYLSFLVNCIWGDKYSLVGIPIFQMMANSGMKKKIYDNPNEKDPYRHARGYADSIFEDSKFNKYYVRGVTFSYKMLLTRLDNMEELGINHAFNHALFLDFQRKLMQSDLKQVMYSKSATNYKNKNKNSVLWLAKY